MAPSDVERIEVFTSWTGFADPPRHVAKLTVARDGNGFTWVEALAGRAGELSPDRVRAVLSALTRVPVPKLDPSLFDLPAEVVEGHYGSVWTDDHPEHLFRITAADGRVIELRAESQYALMLPVKVTGPDGRSETFDPQLSRALAGLLPEGYLERDRLAGRLGMLEYDLDEYRKRGGEPPPLPDPPPPPADPAKWEEAEQELLDILWGKETPEQKAEAERSGNISQRLLKRLSAGEVRDLIARGADVNVADEHGQTALMNAAWPPFDREKFRLLAAAGADVEARRFDGLTGLHIACAGGEAEAAAEWVWAGADANARTTKERATPLMLGARWPKIVRALLAAGADPNAADHDGHTPLAYAVIQQCWVNGEDELAAMRQLLVAGADVNRRDHGGITPLGHARRVLAREQLDAEVCRAFSPDREPAAVALGMAERVVDLLVAAGGRE